MLGFFENLSATFILIVMVVICFVVMTYIYVITYVISQATLQRVTPLLRTTLLALCAISPVVITSVSTLVLFLPSLFKFSTFYEHCHFAQCAAHVPPFFESSSYMMILGVVLFTFTGLGLTLLVKHQRLLDKKITVLCHLLSTHELTAQDDYVYIIDAKLPVLLSVGLLKPKIIVSKEIKETLGQPLFQLVLVYEIIRCKRYTNLLTTLIRACAFMWPKMIKKKLLLDVSEASHEAARNQIKEANLTLPKSPEKIDMQLPNYVNALFQMGQFNVGKVKTAKEPAPLLSALGNIGFIIFSLQLLGLMIFAASAMHYVSEAYF